jgi:hypothetical protein
MVLVLTNATCYEAFLTFRFDTGHVACYQDDILLRVCGSL